MSWEISAIGQILLGKAYSFEMAPGFIPVRRDIDLKKYSIRSVTSNC